MNTLEFPGTTKTLRQRLGEGRIPVQDGLRYAALLAEALRKLHDEGKAHGSVTPDSIVLAATGLDLLPAVPGMIRVTPYTAPEVAGERKPADVRSDIFSFGAVVFETLTGRRAFDGETEAAIVSSVCGAPAPPSGSPAVDRLLAGCLAKDPAGRWQRIQKVQLELKLLTAAARRAGAPAGTLRGGVSDAALRAELVQFEARINAKLQAHEKVVADMQRSASEAVTTLRGHLSTLSAQLATAQAPVSGGDPTAAIEAAGERIAARLQHTIDVLTARVGSLERNPGASEARLNDRLQAHEGMLAEVQRSTGEALNALRGQLSTLGAQLATAQAAVGGGDPTAAIEASERIAARLQYSIDVLTARVTSLERNPGTISDGAVPPEALTRVENGLQTVRDQLSELHSHIAADMHEFELNLKAQSTAIDSARTAMAQTDDLVERVVEALESLQSSVLDQSEDRMMALG